ncbi:hypothetical protein [Streptomyces sp. NPDC058657]|uniref:hypothetical protein n=1 Tax=unclassified Streptomyces TaxID=2593676 RepID=UPI0036523BBF
MPATDSSTPPAAVHRPGRPADLPPAEILWARWAVLATLLATSARERTSEAHRTGFWLASDGDDCLRFDDAGCSWWALRRAPGGRCVLYGEDESSQVKWHADKIDVLAGGPEWLPVQELRDLIASYEIGCVYWYENGTWARAPYPDDLQDDGLDCGMSRLISVEEAAREVEPWLGEEPPGPDVVLTTARWARLLSEAADGTLTEETLRGYLSGAGRAEAEIPLAVEVARRAGLLGG